MNPIDKESALSYHRLGGVPGKLVIHPSKPIENQHHLGLAYTPGVAYPVLEIARDPELAYEYTTKGNLVAVISNGTAVLGLGNRGALASKPVMEGKAALFKKFADIDSIDIEINSVEPETVISVCAAIGNSFGGINLEDIRSPECFSIEEQLKTMLKIPVFHDDQHGTAIILGAALINALEITSKSLTEVKVVFSGAGAAALASASHLMKMGIPREHIWMCDIAGLVYRGRVEEMFAEKEVFAQGDKPASLAEVIEGADVFIGLSAANIVTPEMLRRMRAQPVIFTMANPDPEISYELAQQARPDALLGTGRSDYPNQVNNLLCFPFLFRGALDVRATTINDEMKVAASQALAALAHEEVPAEVLKAYGLKRLEFGKDYVLPKPLDRRVCLWEAPAVAQAAMRSGAARLSLDLNDYQKALAERLYHP
ncbi:MAG TPA: malic enzyme-like NAD(P)-binding protein [Anaerolineaceae bacterium]|jgi:malate dehydrogenase (oxaloacetate-decarboxylating)(NADP+)|nr:malic enzyme-like NAD(P)-binding protein [Anaerolineaceae bacterium]HOS53793.1 malic enzyme-like NAD(P)-binding protein [Anaerolineaceae bacterium]HQK05277.1 malic enzyme-like NAD(P)-binding protein [Anaerolineaceae bacterium]HRS74259.1 malic enzyme-like NAD(P)-binding protein [Anaerolineaceae bacterium]